MTTKAIRVLVVEDHNVVREGLVALLKVADGLEVVGQAADGAEAVAQFRKHQPDITLIDLRLPRMSGVDVIERVRMETPHARFIVLTTYDGDEDIYRALKAGARAYLLKGMTSEEPSAPFVRFMLASRIFRRPSPSGWPNAWARRTSLHASSKCWKTSCTARATKRSRLR